LNIGNKKFAALNDTILVAIKSTIQNSTINKKIVYRAQIVQTKKPIKRLDGTYLRSDKNSAILLKQNNELFASRIKSFVFHESKRQSEHVI
jgi:large subunit ribosomal protein L14